MPGVCAGRLSKKADPSFSNSEDNKKVDGVEASKGPALGVRAYYPTACEDFWRRGTRV